MLNFMENQKPKWKTDWNSNGILKSSACGMVVVCFAGLFVNNIFLHVRTLIFLFFTILLYFTNDNM